MDLARKMTAPGSLCLTRLAYACLNHTLSPQLCPADGQVLFSDLGFSFNQERTGRVGRNGAGKPKFLKLVAGQHAPSAGRVSLTCTLGTLGQLKAVPDDMTFADLFGVRRAPSLLRKAEAGEASKADFGDLDWTLEAVEAGLVAYDGAILLVSHDEAFLARIGITRRLELRSSRLT